MRKIICFVFSLMKIYKILGYVDFLVCFIVINCLHNLFFDICFLRYLSFDI